MVSHIRYVFPIDFKCDFCNVTDVAFSTEL